MNNIHGHRSLSFAGRPVRRYWWHSGGEAPSYVPPIYAFLSDEEWNVLSDWFSETDRMDYIGECQVPLMSLLQGLIMGNQVRSIVQAGHYSGYSTLLLGYMLRRMNAPSGLFTVDIDPVMTAYTRSWVERAGLAEYVRVRLGDSAESALPGEAVSYFGREPRVVFIDSSHAYGHTRRELDRWYPVLCPGGLLVCHDSSERAVSYDSTGQGGVRRAILEWQAEHPEVSGLALAGTAGIHHRDGVYQDGCGVFIAQKPDPPPLAGR